MLLSYNVSNEIVIIRDKYSTEETRGLKGDLLYRWGNLSSYGVDTPQKLGRQHSSLWIKDSFGYNFYQFRQVPIVINSNNDPETENSSALQVSPICLGKDKYLMNSDGSIAPEDFDCKVDTIQRRDSPLKDLENVTFYSALEGVFSLCLIGI